MMDNVVLDLTTHVDIPLTLPSKSYCVYTIDDNKLDIC